MSLYDDLVARLKEGGWVLSRQKRHGVWTHPVTNNVMTIPVTVRDTGRKKDNYFKAIERKEKAPEHRGAEPETSPVITLPPLRPAPPKPTLPSAKRVDPPKIQRTEFATNREELLEQIQGFQQVGMLWFALFKHQREMRRWRREEVAAKVTGWTAGHVRRMEDGKTKCLTKQEAHDLLIALDCPEGLIAPMILSGYLPIDGKSPDIAEPAEDKITTPEATPAVQSEAEVQPEPIQQVIDKRQGGWLTPAPEVMLRERTSRGSTVEFVAQFLGVTPERYLQVEEGRGRFSPTQYSRWKSFLDRKKPLKTKTTTHEAKPEAPVQSPAPTSTSTQVMLPAPQVVLEASAPAIPSRDAIVMRAHNLVMSRRIDDREAQELLEALERKFLEIVTRP